MPVKNGGNLALPAGIQSSSVRASQDKRNSVGMIAMDGHAVRYAIGMIGCGSMGTALAKAFPNSRLAVTNYSLCVCVNKDEQRRALDAFGIESTFDLSDLVSKSDLILVAVRPEQVHEVVKKVVTIAPPAMAAHKKILVSLAAGVTLSSLAALAGETFDVVRIMPNILVQVGKGIFGLCVSPGVSPDTVQRIRNLFEAIGCVVEFEESKMNVFTALAGCGPAFLFHILESLAEAGVSAGLGRKESLMIAVALLEGCGSLAATTGTHPALLREQGVSPAGMTIAGLNHLDRVGLRGHLIDAVKMALDQGRLMDKDFCPEK
ncbi:MAG: pyrroline-5-carboxylate reductase [Solidesulfovibrio sp.]|uniref:pyrroline-5-carboxylate reductase n=1 Tax=Solidesulfovibrio sp. TaxID=2910990 RepID=UPI003158927C